MFFSRIKSNTSKIPQRGYKASMHDYKLKKKILMSKLS